GANMYRYVPLAFQNRAGTKTRTPLRRQAPADVLEKENFEMRLKAEEPAHSSGKLKLTKGMRSPHPLRRFLPPDGALTGGFMFPDLARGDVFRLATPMLC